MVAISQDYDSNLSEFFFKTLAKGKDSLSVLTASLTQTTSGLFFLPWIQKWHKGQVYTCKSQWELKQIHSLLYHPCHWHQYSLAHIKWKRKKNEKERVKEGRQERREERKERERARTDQRHDLRTSKTFSSLLVEAEENLRTIFEKSLRCSILENQAQNVILHQPILISKSPGHSG